jgi:nicotinate-nucleotide adenylyltransferase
MKRIAYYGGTFDPVHLAHTTLAREIPKLFLLDEFVFLPAYHAPHKRSQKPTSAFHRFAMLALATREIGNVKVSTLEVEAPENPYSIQTLTRLNAEMPAAKIFFVIGADSWAEITLWREWEKVLTLANIIVVHRPNIEIGFAHVTDEIRNCIVDLRGKTGFAQFSERKIYFTDAVSLDISATEIRRMIREGDLRWRELVSADVAEYIVKQQLYLD